MNAETHASSLLKKFRAVSAIVFNASSDNVFSKKNSSPFMHNSIKLIIFWLSPFSQFLLISIALCLENMLRSSLEAYIVVELAPFADTISGMLNYLPEIVPDRLEKVDYESI